MQLINDTTQNNFNQAVYLYRISKCDQHNSHILIMLNKS